MELLSGILALAGLVALMAVWLYGFAHSLFNHGRAGLAFLMLAIPVLALFYTFAHLCPPEDETTS